MKDELLGIVVSHQSLVDKGFVVHQGDICDECKNTKIWKNNKYNQIVAKLENQNKDKDKL